MSTCLTYACSLALCIVLYCGTLLIAYPSDRGKYSYCISKIFHYLQLIYIGLYAILLRVFHCTVSSSTGCFLSGQIKHVNLFASKFFNVQCFAYFGFIRYSNHVSKTLHTLKNFNAKRLTHALSVPIEKSLYNRSTCWIFFTKLL